MNYIVSITSQGQISIPAQLRRKLNLDKYHKALVHEENNQLIIEPVEDLLQSQGTLSAYSTKNKKIADILKAEKTAWEDEVVSHYKKRKK